MALAVPQTNPKANYLAHKDEIDAAIARVLDSGWYILGQEVTAFEAEFASYLGVAHAIGVASGTDALQLALRAAGVGRGDLVLTVSHTAVATVAAIELCEAIPVFVDIDPLSYTMDPRDLDTAIATLAGAPLKAVIPVHLYGHPADMPSITRIAEQHNLIVIEDCAQSQGAVVANKKTGAWGQFGAFSFYPTKNLGALGDGGMVVTCDPEWAAVVRSLREYGWKQRYISECAGLNSRLDELQAAILRVKLLYLDSENATRQKLAECYDALLKDSSLTLPQMNRTAATHVYHQYVVRTPERDSLRAYLRDHGIGTLIHYPVPVHQQPAYAARLPYQRELAHTDNIAKSIVSLPMYPEMGADQLQWVAEQILAWIKI